MNRELKSKDQVRALTELLRWANGDDHFQDYADQRGVYGLITKALEIIVLNETGVDLGENYPNYGGNETWFSDVIGTILYVHEQQDEQARMERESAVIDKTAEAYEEFSRIHNQGLSNESLYLLVPGYY